MMRDRETIDSELRRLAEERRFFREHGDELSISPLDDLLDERLGHRAHLPAATAVQSRPRVVVADRRPSKRRPHTLRRLAFRAAIPISAVTLAAALMTVVVVHNRPRTDEPTPVPQSDQLPESPGAQPPPASAVPPPPKDAADKAIVDVLTREGVPVPSAQYAIDQGHAVCDFLGRQPDLADAAHFVQRSSVWDADQSAEFTSAAVVTYCPQFAAAGSDKMQQTLQTAQSNLRAIEGDLRGINTDLDNIRDNLHGEN